METLSKKWVRDLKIAIINEDGIKVQDLYKEIPDFKDSGFSLEELEEVQALIGSAIDLLRDDRSNLSRELNKLKATMAYQKNMIS